MCSTVASRNDVVPQSKTPSTAEFHSNSHHDVSREELNSPSVFASPDGAILKHPDNVLPLLKMKIVMRQAEKQIPQEPHWGFCYGMLHKVSRSFTLVIQQLDTDLRDAVRKMLFALTVSALINLFSSLTKSFGKLLMISVQLESLIRTEAVQFIALSSEASSTQTIGKLSYTSLTQTWKEDIVDPMRSFFAEKEWRGTSAMYLMKSKSKL